MQTTPSLLNKAQRQAIMDSILWTKYFACLASKMRQGEYDFAASPFILERKFRDQIEIYYSKDHGRYPNGWYVGDGAAYSLVDALLQVRDAVGSYCSDGSYDLAYEYEDFTEDSPLYKRFRDANIAFPIEPEKGFSMVDWQAPFESFPEVVAAVVRLQMWGLHMTCCLHALVHYEGNTGGGNLPPFPHCAFIEGKKAFDDYTRTSCPSWWQEPDPEGVPKMWGNDEHYYFAINDQERQDYIQELEELQKFKSSLAVPAFLIQNRLRARFEEMDKEGDSQSSEDGPSEVVAPPSIPPGLEQEVISLDSDGEWEYPTVLQPVTEFIDVFSEELFKKLPEHRSFDCNIDFVEGSDLPKPAKVYPLSPIESRTIKEFIDQELADGKIRPSKSPIASPCFFVKKKDGSLRLVTDYRKINNITIPDQFPMPLQVELVDQVKNAKIYSKLDLRWGFNNIRIKEGDEWKTAFRTAYGIYEYLVMPFGLKNAPAVLQRMMNDIFRHLLGVTVVVYMDDILIFSEKEEDHAEHVKEVLKILRDNNLYAKLAKCEFFVKKVIFLGLVITPEGISMEEEKIKAIMEWGAPRKIKEVQAFLGFVNFYRRFIAEFSKIARPLHDLTKRDTRFEWSQECQQAFEEIKKRVSQDPVLIHPDPDKPFILETDASGIAIGAILSQRGEDGYLHPVAYLSKSYNDAQRNYDTANKELLAIVESLKHWRIYLEGTILPVTVFTDHRNLERWKNAETFNRRHARWHMELASFNFEIHYRPGKMSNKPDALSRRHDHEDIPNPQQIMINAERFKGFKANIEIDIISMIRESLSDDESLTTLIESTKKKEDLPPSIRKQYDKYEWKEDLLWYEGRIVIPENKEIRLAILEMHHDNPIAGHQGQARTLELISRRYYWPAMKQQVNRFVETCEICQRSKGHKQYAPPKPLPIPQKPWEDIAYDFIVKLPESQGMDSILVVINRFSRQAYFIPCLESTNAEGVADLFVKEVWKIHGLPKTTVSDRGPTFNSQFLKALYTKLGIKPKFSTAFHPETDGITERTNQWLEGFLRSFCNYRQDDWVRWLPIAEFCHNNQVNSATGKTAFETIYGLHPRWDLVDLEVNAPNAADMADSMQEIWDEVIASMEFHRSKEDTPKHEYKVGDKVWLVGQNITTRRPSKKLDNKKLGPFVISERISSHVYRLELPKTMRTHN
ncbi:Retrotransposable element Tf2 protein [Ceratobasidium sp. AG-Ba]|nr:Retrotransposable element Tf2 protein [Ceratobasidium sp. AG-Ba]